jgi:uncharacterized protein
MIPRRLQNSVVEHLNQFPAVALLGPRQVGKTTLARAIADARASVYLDLESAQDREKLADPEFYLAPLADKLVVIDEVHRMPGLFETLRGLIDTGRRRGKTAGRFLLLGSASMELLRQSGESLAGRIAYLELGPLDVVDADGADAQSLWLRGGFPDSFLAVDERHSVRWRSNFIRSYLERDIPSLAPRMPTETVRRIWSMLAHSQSALFNASNFAKALAVDGKTVAKHLDLLVDLLLVRRLPPMHSNLGKRIVKSPKVYVRDSGVLHALLGLQTRDQLFGHPAVGASWEGFVIENLIAAAPVNTEAFFFRTISGAEIDLVLNLPGNQRWAIEVKRGLTPKVERGFHLACDDVKPDRRFVVYAGQDRYGKAHGIEAIGLAELAHMLVALEV